MAATLAAAPAAIAARLSGAGAGWGVPGRRSLCQQAETAQAGLAGLRTQSAIGHAAAAATATDRRLNIRLSSKDLEAIQKRALAEGLPYQTLIASLLHKYASGRLKEV